MLKACHLYQPFFTSSYYMSDVSRCLTRVTSAHFTSTQPRASAERLNYHIPVISLLRLVTAGVSLVHFYKLLGLDGKCFI